MIAYVSIGNSDDKLTQQEWSEYSHAVDGLLRMHGKLHGAWFSLPDSGYQNACWCVEFSEFGQGTDFRADLKDLARFYGQDSIAFAPVITTEFLGSDT